MRTMKRRTKRNCLYVLLMLLCICIINVWITICAVKNHVISSSDDPIRTNNIQQALPEEDADINRSARLKQVIRSSTNGQMLKDTTTDKVSIEDVLYGRHNTTDSLRFRADKLESDAKSRESEFSYWRYINQTSGMGTGTYAYNVNLTDKQDVVFSDVHNATTNIGVHDSELINKIPKNVVSSEISNVTTYLIVNTTEVTEQHIEDEVDVADSDDHVYLVENLDFKRVLEDESDTTLSPESMWKHRLDNNSSYADRKRIYDMYYRKIVNQGGVNCHKLIEKDPETVSTANDIMTNVPRKGIREGRYVFIKDCNRFKRVRGYIEHPLSDSERDFPLAFGIIMYTDVEQTERLLRAIYRPHNFYCIHVDSKSDKIIRLAIEKIARCLHNVFIATNLVNVTWGEFSVLQADLNCMQDLLKYKSWKYYINLTGQEFPLKTNREIVKILEAMDGANIVDGTWVRANMYFYRWTSAGNRPPHGIRPIKGSVHVLVNRQFVDFSLHDKRALDFLEWLRKTQIPDETYFSSLNHNPHLGIKGSFLGEAEEYPLKPAFMRYKNWEFGHSAYSRICSGKYVRHICILGIGDLHSAYHDIALFVNKFHLDYEYLALDCLEEVLHKKTWQQYLDNTDIDVSYYKHLDYVKYKLS